MPKIIIIGSEKDRAHFITLLRLATKNQQIEPALQLGLFPYQINIMGKYHQVWNVTSSASVYVSHADAVIDVSSHHLETLEENEVKLIGQLLSMASKNQIRSFSFTGDISPLNFLVNVVLPQLPEKKPNAAQSRLFKPADCRDAAGVDEPNEFELQPLPGGYKINVA